MTERQLKAATKKICEVATFETPDFAWAVSAMVVSLSAMLISAGCDSEQAKEIFSKTYDGINRQVPEILARHLRNKHEVNPCN